MREMEGTGPQSTGRREAGHREGRPGKNVASRAPSPKGLSPQNTWKKDALQAMLLHNRGAPFPWPLRTTGRTLTRVAEAEHKGLRDAKGDWRGRRGSERSGPRGPH